MTWNPNPKLPPYKKYCLCRKCGEYFTTARNFDHHRTGPMTNRKCTHPSKLTGRRQLVLNPKGYWQAPGTVYLPPHKREKERETRI